MTITRTINGELVQIELTYFEKDDAYREMKKHYVVEDILSRYPTMSRAQAGDIADRVERNLDHSDRYWDSYWDVLEYTCTK